MRQFQYQLRKALSSRFGQTLAPEVCAAIEADCLSSGIHLPTWELYTRNGLLELLCGDEDAADLVEMVAQWSHVYDDLIDKDKPVSDARLHQAMWAAMFGISENRHFLKHQVEYTAILKTGVINWIAANEMQASGCQEQLAIAHAIRYSIGDIALLAMQLTGGYEHAFKNASRCRLMLQADTWANYSKEFLHV